MMTKKNTAREFSYLIKADELSNQIKTYTLLPSHAECQEIAKRIGVLSVDTVTAKANCVIESGHLVHVKGQFSVEVTQECVVTLEPIKNTVSDEFEGWYSDQEHVASFKKAQMEAKSKKEFTEVPLLDEKDDPEPLENGYVDVGELFVQFLSLAIDHYAHKDGVSVDAVTASGKSTQNESENLNTAKKYAPQNPFAALKNWRPKD